MLTTKWYQNILIIFCFFVYFFPFRIYGFDPRLLVFIIYIFCGAGDFLSFKGRIRSRYVKSLFFPYLMLLFTVFVSCINTITENTFIIFIFQLIYLLILTYCIYYITRKYCKTIDFYIITHYFIVALVVQSIIAIVMFVNRPVCLFLFDLQGIDLNSRTIQMYWGLRLIGLGCFYFGAGIIYGLGLISLIPLILKSNVTKQRIKLMLLYVYLFVVGIFFSRTCMVGAAMSFAYLLSCIFIPKIRTKVLAVISKFFVFLILIATTLVGIYLSSPQLQEDYGDIINFGFEAFINLSENGEFSTMSSDGLKEYHLNIWPKDPKTYYFGDTQWTSSTGSYYGDSDVGYIRLLYYFGIPGVILFLLYQYSIARILNSIFRDRLLSFYFLIVFLYSVVLLVKGYTDTASLLFIYLHYHSYESKNKNIVLC